MDKHSKAIVDFTDILARVGGGLSEIEPHVTNGADISIQQAIMRITEARLWLINSLGIIKNNETKS